MTHIDKHTVTMEVEYHRPGSKYAPLSKIKRTVMVDGRRVHMEETLPGDDPTASSAAKFERWCVDAERREYRGGEQPTPSKPLRAVAWIRNLVKTANNHGGSCAARKATTGR